MDVAGGGQTSTVTPANGGTTTSTSPTTVPPMCLGMPPQTSIGSTCTARLPLDPIPASNASCVFKLPIGSNYRLNPAMVRFYFATSDGGTTEIPYVGTFDGCASATTYGGWYATNIAGGDSDVGYCPCTCNAAHKYSVTVDISCDGIPK
jgi:hypothetical protein